MVYSIVQEKVASRDDPFTNAGTLAIIIFIVVLQKYVVEYFLTDLLDEEPYFDQKLVVTFRQSLVAIEILFI